MMLQHFLKTFPINNSAFIQNKYNKQYLGIFIFVANLAILKKMSREVITKFENIEQLEGAGVKIRRSIGSRQVYIYIYIRQKLTNIYGVSNFSSCKSS